jgi:hypothetical protein
MDCKNARLLLEFVRPRGTELDSTETEALESHLAECPECGPLAHAERRVDDHFSRAIRDVPVPNGLRDRLIARLSGERDAWYRRWLLRTAGMVAAAAVLLLVVWGVLLWHDTRPELDINEVYVDERPTNSPQDVETWFRKTHGLRIAAPSDRLLDYRWLTYYGLEKFEGQRVPMLLFTYSRPEVQARAKLFIVTTKEFKVLKRQVNQVRRLTGGYTVELVPSRDVLDVYYVVIYPDGSRQRFFVKRSFAT